jgi:8-oxo-dGTP pyrophosphatase MutT (NUDIX family)
MKKIIEDRVAQIISNISADFDISKISRSPARFNTEKLNWFNREYIKKLSLQEFCWRSSDLRLQKKFDSDKKLRVGDYVYFVDLTTNRIFANLGGSSYGQDGNFYLIGGGRDEGETPIEGLVREVKEETFGKVKIDLDKLVHITSVQLLSSMQWERDGKVWDGKELNFWFYPLCEGELPSYQLFEDGTQDRWVYDWHNLTEVIETNDFVNYPIWSEFCRANNISTFTPTENIVIQYLAWNLDKNRVTVLSEIGMDSDCILRYIKPEKEVLKWKKITLEESLVNLAEIKNVVLGVYEELEPERNLILQSSINDLPSLHLELSAKWEVKLKFWIGENNKDSGSYFWPLRVALSGKQKSPSPFEILAILGKEEIESRLTF